MAALDPALIVTLVSSEDGSLRFAGSRVTLDSILHRFLGGDTPEEIGKGFPDLRLAEIYGAISYYLSCKEDIDRYLHRRQAEALENRKRVEALPGAKELRGYVQTMLDRS